MSVDLKPCPFCGGDAAIRKWQDEELWSHAIVEWQKVHCTECECEGISSCPGYEQDTMQAWNTRAPQWQPIESAPSQGCILAFSPDDGQFVATRSGNSWCLDTGDVMLIMEPTHWQPLPTPPEVP